tara:strand:- start:3490 stop:5382 length:1893 start_codon:yes stop_codon:yes gene_type:complete
MCGINGYFSQKPNKNCIQVINKMNDSIIHRGPDDDGLFCEEGKEYSLAMGMRRLSIIDLNSGKQPIFSHNKTKVIVFNGEIYNYQILKSQLELEGVNFITTSDTEVIMRLYEKYGVKSFGMLDGMFAFSIYDQTLDKVFITRDFFGEKPLYYYHDGDNFYWASELKSIKRVSLSELDLSYDAISLFLQLTYIPAPHTIYKNIYKLEPNSFIEFDCNNNSFSLNTIANTSNNLNPVFDNISFKEAKNITRDLIFKSVKSRSISDVPLGTFLSGGVDSSIVSYCLSKDSDKKIDTFSIGFEKKSFDETDKARTVSKLINSNHHEHIISDKDLSKDIDLILLNYDEPFADPSALPTFLVSKYTSDFVKVALTGDGGDELFGGYNKYYMGKINNIYTKYIPKSGHNSIIKISNNLFRDKSDNRGLKFKMNKLLKAVDYNEDFYFKIISLGFQEKELYNILSFRNNNIKLFDYYKKDLNKIKSLNDYRDIDRRLSLEGALLVKVDRASMLNSIECRSPFLNKQILNFTTQLPEKYLLKGWNKKHLLKESFKMYFPDGFLENPKQGFAVPVGDWLRGSLKNELENYINRDFLFKQNIFNVDLIRKLVNDHLKSINDNTYRVWTFYCFQKWYVNNIN